MPVCPGPSGCCIGCDVCYPCPLPQTSLTVSFLNESVDPPTMGAGSIAYLGGCVWNGCIPITRESVAFSYMRFIISCSESCTAYSAEVFPLPGCSGILGAFNFYDHPSGCSSFTGSRMTLTSFSCSPLNIVFTNSLNPQVTWTITA